ncbi:hypothetical protein LAL4801_06199 [Roseibium aggregatum]|uniref:Uncharacterized protein n=1 Tax=Roseibium aggregatum TaxID=187304 RepID=A0A0M6YFX8_9HYPH|nr:hypothetical protein LAL4801_06199 [Roseibium aggregatum]
MSAGKPELGVEGKALFLFDRLTIDGKHVSKRCCRIETAAHSTKERRRAPSTTSARWKTTEIVEGDLRLIFARKFGGGLLVEIPQHSITKAMIGTCGGLLLDLDDELLEVRVGDTGNSIACLRDLQPCRKDASEPADSSAEVGVSNRFASMPFDVTQDWTTRFSGPGSFESPNGKAKCRQKHILRSAAVKSRQSGQDLLGFLSAQKASKRVQRLNRIQPAIQITFQKALSAG